MKKFNKSRLNIIGATVMAIFSLASVFSATYAWFALNTTATGTGMNVEIKKMNGRLHRVYFHAFDAANSNSSTFKFNRLPFATYEYDWDEKQINVIDDEYATWDLGKYSYTDKDHCLLVLFEFDQDYISSHAGDMYVRGVTTVGGENFVTTYSQSTGEALETTGGGFLGARTNDGVPYYTLPQTQVNDSTHLDSILMKKVPLYDGNGDPVLDKNGNQKYRDYYALSSVATFSHRTFDNAAYTSFLAASGDTTLDFATNTLQAGNSFTTIKNNTDKYVFNQSPNLFESDGHSTVKYIALIINYSPEAIGYIYSTYLGDAGLNSYDSVLHFACDWRYEVF